MNGKNDQQPKTMKYLSTLITALLSITILQAQTTALDFTRQDCDGMDHTLFAELDAGNVIVLELVMMGCQPCVTAAQSLIANVLPNVSDPARVKIYSIGFTNSITCAQMNDWKNTNGFTHTVFAGMSAQTTYFGGMGMPTIAVLGGGSTHQVYYNDLGHDDSNNPTILAAIEDALAGGMAIGVMNATQVTVHPNPVADELLFGTADWTNARILDLQGREVLLVQPVAGALDVSMLPPGVFVLHLTNAAGVLGISRFEKK